MTSFEFFRLLRLKKYGYFFIYFHTFFLLKYIICDKTHHFMGKKIKYVASNHGIITGYHS